MGSNGAEDIRMSEPTIEIKVKTLDSQTYTLKVDKEMPVPILKEQIASVTGVLSEQQRLICRGKVLKDDQLLSAYHVEDGHTLHLVVRQPIPPSSEGQTDHSVLENDPASSTSHGRSSVFIESFSLPVGGDAQPDYGRLLSAVLGSVGIPNIATASEGVDLTVPPGENRPERTSGLSGLFGLTQLLSEQNSSGAQTNGSNEIFGRPGVLPLGNLQPLVIPDSLSTLSRYLSHIRSDFQAIARAGGHSQAANHGNDGSSNSSSGSGIREGPTSPASLAEVIRTARLLFIEQVGESLRQLASQLENQAHVTDHLARRRIQATLSNTGAVIHNLGACLLELGRTMMTVQMGLTPSDAVVNAGPAIFISPTGPNPIMVQPLPFQSGMSVGATPVGARLPGSGVLNGLDPGFHPRRIDIQIQRGSPTTSVNVNREEHQRNSAPISGSENPANQTAPSISDGSASEPSVTEEGLFLSNLLQQVMPVISQAATREQVHIPAEARNPSEHTSSQDSSIVMENSNVGTSRRHSHSDCDKPPSPKRQKTE